MMRKLTGGMDKGGHYYMEIKLWMQKGQYDSYIKREDG